MKRSDLREALTPYVAPHSMEAALDAVTRAWTASKGSEGSPVTRGARAWAVGRDGAKVPCVVVDVSPTTFQAVLGWYDHGEPIITAMLPWASYHGPREEVLPSDREFVRFSPDVSSLRYSGCLLRSELERLGELEES